MAFVTQELRLHLLQHPPLGLAFLEFLHRVLQPIVLLKFGSMSYVMVQTKQQGFTDHGHLQGLVSKGALHGRSAVVAKVVSELEEQRSHEAARHGHHQGLVTHGVVPRLEVHDRIVVAAMEAQPEASAMLAL